MIRARAGVVSAGLQLAGCFLGATLSGQDGPGDCQLARSEVARPLEQSDGTRVVYITRPVFRCSDGVEIRADSAILREAAGFSQFFRNVYMRDGARVLEANQAQYAERQRQLVAIGSVRVRDAEDGTELTGGNLRYLRAGAGREVDVLRMTGADPHARFVPSTPAPEPDSAGVVPEVPEPRAVDLSAGTIVLVGSDIVRAQGRVHLWQDSLDAFADSLEYAEADGRMSLFGQARMISPGSSGDTLDLRGDTIVASMPGGLLQEVEARHRAQVLGAEVHMTGPRLRLHFQDEELVRTVAVVGPKPDSEPEPDPAQVPSEPDNTPPDSLAPAPERPEARTEEYTIFGDSIEVRTPAGVIETVFAAGAARAESTAGDSLNTADTPAILLRDWIEGDSITAYFVHSDGAAEEAAGSTNIERIVATGRARSLSRFRPDSAAADSASNVLNANYVTGSQIRIFLVDGEVDDMEVDDAQGIFLQPRAPTPVVAPADTTRGPSGTEP